LETRFFIHFNIEPWIGGGIANERGRPVLEHPPGYSMRCRDPDLILLDIRRNKGPKLVRFLVIKEYGACLAIHDAVGVLDNKREEGIQIHLRRDDLTHLEKLCVTLNLLFHSITSYSIKIYNVSRSFFV
jgi:hypothetical protein